MASWKKSYRLFLYGAVTFLVFVLMGSIFFILKGGKSSLADKPNIILIVVDCLRADHVGYSGYKRNTTPYLDRLAKSGVVFTDAYSNAPWTKPSVVSLLTSLLPDRHGAINRNDALTDAPLTLGEILSGLDYETLYLNGGNAWITQKFNIPQGFDFQYHAIVRADELTRVFLSVMSQTQKMFFAYIHYMDAHVPYYENKYTGIFTKGVNDDLKPGNINYSKVEQLMRSGKLTHENKDYLEAVYDGQVRFVDENINKIIRALKDQDLLDKTLVIITSDHGDEFWEHGNYEHGHTLYNELLKVPLIIAGMNLQHQSIRDRVRLIDIAPTVVDLVGLDNKSFDFNGKSLLGLMSGRRETDARPLFATGTLYNEEKYCYIDLKNIKIILNTGLGEGKVERYLANPEEPSKKEFYDLDLDPLEKKSRITDEEKLKIEEELKFSMKQYKKMDKDKVVIDNKLEEQLRSLGYTQ